MRYVIEKKKKQVSWYDALWYSPSVSPNFCLWEDNGIPGEVPCEYELRGCDFVFFGDGYN